MIWTAFSKLKNSRDIFWCPARINISLCTLLGKETKIASNLAIFASLSYSLVFLSIFGINHCTRRRLEDPKEPQKPESGEEKNYNKNWSWRENNQRKIKTQNLNMKMVPMMYQKRIGTASSKGQCSESLFAPSSFQKATKEMKKEAKTRTDCIKKCLILWILLSPEKNEKKGRARGGVGIVSCNRLMTVWRANHSVA